MSVKNTLNKHSILQRLSENTDGITEFGVSRIGLFGSMVRNEQTEDSDLDFLVEFKKDQKNYDNFIHLVFYLENIFEKEVDLITRQSISKRLKKYIDKDIEYLSFHS